MYKLLLSLFIITFSASYSFGQDTGVSCIIDDVRVKTNSEEDCKKIGGKAQSTFLFVINFDNGSFDGKKLQLNGNGTSNVIYFTDVPERKAGHMGIKKFRTIWTKGINSFKSDPPNATLSLVIKGKDSDSVMTLTNPMIKDYSIIFEVELIEGSPTETFKTGGLFIDPAIMSFTPDY